MSPVEEMLAQAPRFPRRIACLTEETTETLYRIGAGDLVVGVSCYTLRPAAAREKPKVSSFLEVKMDALLDVKPDLVLAFSDLQADIAQQLAKRGVPVYVFNQRSVSEVLQSVRVTGALVGRHDAACALADVLASGLLDVASRAKENPRRVRVLFEEWPEPFISGIRWVSELIEIAGGDDVCAHTRARPDAKGRMVDVAAARAADPEVIIASWCGKKARVDSLRERWAGTSAVAADQLYEVPSELILQPGPAALTDGVAALERIIRAVARGEVLAPAVVGDLRRGDVGHAP